MNLVAYPQGRTESPQPQELEDSSHGLAARNVSSSPHPSSRSIVPSSIIAAGNPPRDHSRAAPVIWLCEDKGQEATGEIRADHDDPCRLFPPTTELIDLFSFTLSEIFRRPQPDLFSVRRFQAMPPKMLIDAVTADHTVNGNLNHRSTIIARTTKPRRSEASYWFARIGFGLVRGNSFRAELGGLGGAAQCSG